MDWHYCLAGCKCDGSRSLNAWGVVAFRREVEGE